MAKLSPYKVMDGLALQTIEERQIDDYWRSSIILQSVYRLLQELCFLQNPKMFKAWEHSVLDLQATNMPDDKILDYANGHKDCLIFWFSLPPERRMWDFFCLGIPTICSNCGDNINSLVYAKDSELHKNQCPVCGTEIEGGLGLERDRWWEALADAAGRQLVNINQNTTRIMASLILRLARFYIQARIINYPDNNKGQAVSELNNTLLEFFGSTQRTVCYDAARWAVWEDSIKAHLNEDPNEKLPTFQQKRAALPLLITAIERNKEETTDIIGSVWEELTSEKPLQERVASARAIVKPEYTPPQHITTPAIKAGDYLVIKGGNPSTHGLDVVDIGLDSAIIRWLDRLFTQ